MKHWPTKPLAEVATIVRGVSFDKSEVSDMPRENSIPILRAGNIRGSLITDSDLVYVPTQLVSEEQRMRRGDLAICMSSGSSAIVGKTAHLDTDWNGSVGAFCAIVRFKGHLHHRFGSYWFRSPMFLRWRDSNAKGANIQNLRRVELERLPLPVPPMAEQQRIVKLLDEADELRKLREQANRRTADLIPALFQEMLNDMWAESWKECSFGDADTLEIIDGDRGTNYPKKTDFRAEGYCLFLNTGNVRRSMLDFSECDFITREKDDVLRKGKLARGDVILTTRGTLGNSALYDQTVDYDNVRINSGMVILRVKSSFLLPEFLLLVLNSDGFTAQVAAMTSGTAQPQLPINRLLHIKYNLPPLQLQKQLVSRVTEIREMEASQAASRQRLDELFQSMLHRAFNGEL